MARGYRFGVVGSLSTVPDGSTVTPINNVSILLQCAGIQNSTYTTLTEIFNDTGVLSAVINSNNAINYLVRCTGFAKAGLVPKMTSDTEPIGETFVSSAHTNNYAYFAFDGDSSTLFRFGANNTNNYIGYHFTTAVQPKKCRFSTPGRVSAAPSTRTFVVQGSNDNITWTQIGSGTLSMPTVNVEAWAEAELDGTNIYSYLRVFFADVMYSTGGSWAIQIDNVQFYTVDEGFTDNATVMSYIGANNYASNTLRDDSTWLNAICNSTYFESVLNAKVPVMTSATTPSGEVIVSSYVSGMEGYKAFDNNTSTYWRVYGNNLNGAYIIYHFTTQVSVNKVVTSYATSSGATVIATLWELYGSNNNTDYIDIGEVGANSAGTESILINNNKYAYYKLVCKHANVSSSVTYGFIDLQFYGRVDV